MNRPEICVAAHLYFRQGMPAVTVIINICNGADTLAEAIDSVLAQTFTDWELLVYDDRSTDNSPEIVARYVDGRIRYVCSESQVPLGQARQRAIDRATGDWIAFLDQDDVWLPHKLERQLTVAREHPHSGLIYGRTVRFYADGRQRDYDQAHEYSGLPEGNIFRDLFVKSCFPAMSSAMFRRSALAAVGPIPDNITIIPDYYLYTAVTRRFPAAAVQEVVCRYRMHPRSASHERAASIHQEALLLMDIWSADVDPGILARCKRHHSTQLALAEMHTPNTSLRGLSRLFTQGSVASQLVRPFYFVFHLLRRNLVAPHWQTLKAPAAQPIDLEVARKP